MPDFSQISNQIAEQMAAEQQMPVQPAPLAPPSISQKIEEQMMREKASSFTEKAKGFGEAIARGALTGPGATLLETKVLGVPKQEIRIRKEEIGETAEAIGQTIGLVVPALFTFGESIAARAGIQGIVQTGKLASIARAANQATYLTMAGNLAARKATSDVAKKAIAFGVEGALMSAMDPITTQMLSDHPVDTMKTASNVVSHALFGGAFGAAGGAAVGKIAPLWKAQFGPKAQRALEPVLGDAPPLTTVEAIESLAPASERGLLKKALSEQMPRKAEFIKETAARGIPVTDAMTSESSLVHKWGGSIIDSPTVPAAIQRIKYDNGFKRVNQIVRESLKTNLSPEASGAEIGDLIFDSIEPKIRAQKQANDALYQAVRNETQFIPVDTTDIEEFASKILKLDRVVDNPSAPSSKFAKELAGDLLDRAKIGNYSVTNLDNQIASIGERMGKTASEKSFAFELKEILEDLRTKQVEKFATDMMVPGDEAAEAIKSLLQASKAAKESYGPFKKKLEGLGKVFGFKSAGPADFLYKFSEMKPEQIVKRLSSKENSEALKFMSEFFPEELQLVIDHQKNNILKKFSIQDMTKSGPAIKEIFKLPKELRQTMFSKQQLKDLEIAQWWLDRAAKLNINPSKTSMGVAINEYFTGKAAIMTLGDVAKIGLIKAYTGGAKPSATAFKAMTDYFMSANQGALVLQKLTKSLIKEENINIKESPKRNLDFIDNQAKKLLLDPKVIRDTDDELSHYLPQQYQAVKTLQARVLNYINQQRPLPKKNGPLGKEYPPSVVERARFKKTLEIADQPNIILNKIQNGTLQSRDVQDLNAMYPELKNEMMYQIVRNVADKMKKNQPIPFKLKKGLSIFGAMPVDSSFTPRSIQSAQSVFVKSNVPQQQQMPAMAPKSSRKSEQPEMAQTDSQRRMSNR